MIRITSCRIVTTLAICLGSVAMGSVTLAAPPEPCSLLTAAEIEQVVGKLNGSPKTDKEGGVPRCAYEFANGKDAMEVWVFPGDAIDRARKRAKNPVVVKGLGDDQARLPVCW